MGTTLFVVVCSAFVLTFVKNIQAEPNLELAGSYVTEISNFAAHTLVQDEQFGLQDASLLTVLDARRSSQPDSYVVTLDMGAECISEECQASKICEVHVIDAKESGQRSILKDKTRCVQKETRAFTDLSGGLIATKLSLDDDGTRSLVEHAVKQIAEKTEEAVSLLRVVRARQAWDGPSKLFYLTLNVESKKPEQSPTNEVCDVSIEEGPTVADNTVSKQSLRSLHCFTTSEVDLKSDDSDSFFQDQIEEIPAVKLLDLARTAHSFVSADSASNFQSKLLGYSLVSNRASPDSGVKEILLRLGLAPTVCLKSSDNDDSDAEKSCNIDTDRDAAICSITATQWPWLEGSHLFSDLSCDAATLRRINEELTPITKDEIASSVAQVESDPAVDGVVETTFGSSPAFCTGCAEDVSTDSEKIKELAQFAMSAVDGSVNSDKAQGLVNIVKATQQVVSGIKYQLTLAVSDTDCEKTSSDRSSCAIDSQSTVQHCKVTIIEQAWKNRLEVLETVCGAAANPTGEDRESKLLGGVEDASVNADDVLEMAQFALDTLDAFDENDKKRMLVKVLESKKQVVAGTLYTMKLQFSSSDCAESSVSCENNEKSPAFICDVQVLSQPWEATSRKLLQSKCAPAGGKGPRAVPLESEEPAPATPQPVVEEPFEKVDVPRLGDTEPVDPNSDLAKRFAQYAVTAVEEESNSEAKLKLVDIRSSSVQIVAGRLISLSIVVGSTNCNRQDSIQNDACELNPRGDLQLCNVEIWERSWLNEIQVKQLSCRPKAQEDDLVVAASALSEDFDESPFVGEVPTSFVVGGIQLSSRQKVPCLVGDYSPADVSDPKVVEMAEFSKVAISNAVNAKEGVKLIKIDSAETQVVAGTNYRLKVAVAAGKAQHSCQVVIFDQPWTQTRKVTSVSCAPAVSEPERTVGGFTPDDPSHPKIQQVVAFSLPAIANGFNGGKPVDLVRVESAESQVVSGVNYRVKLIVQAEDSQYSCSAVIFDQPWVEVNQLTSLSCAPVPTEPRPGGFKTQDPKDPKVQEMAIFSLETVAQEVNGGNSVELIEVRSARTQLVAGLNYNMNIVVGAGEQRHACDVVVWDQPWTSTRKVTSVACTPQTTASNGAQDQVSRSTRSGGYKPRDPNDAKVQEMAVFSLSAIGQQINENSDLNLIRVLSAESQVVAGVNYKLKLVAGTGQRQHICEVVVFDQSWTGTRKVSSVSCVPDAAESTTTEVPTTKRKKILGGYTRRDPNEPRIQKMAEFSLTAIGQAINSEDPVELIQIEQVETQVVSGTNYKMKLVVRSGGDQHSCQVVVWDQPWTKTRQVTSVSCVPQENPPNPEESTDPPTRLVGGYSPVNVTDPDVQEIAAFSLSAIAKGVNGGEPVQLVQIESAQTQVVAGTNYKLKLVVGAGDTRHSCEVVVFDQPWTATREVTSISCVPSDTTGSHSSPSPGSEGETASAAASRPGKQLLGGFAPEDPNRPDVKEMAAFSLAAISHGVNGGKPVQLVRVEAAATQIVAGVNYKLKLVVTAEKNHQLTCDVVIFDQSWTGTREVTDLSCTPEGVNRSSKAISSSRIDRQTLQGYSPADLSSSQIQGIATFPLAAISKAVNGGKAVQLVQVDEAATQIVPGINRKLKLVVGADQNQLACNVYVFDQPWTGTRDGIELLCNPRGTVDASSNERPLLGGYTPADPDDPKVQDAATFSLSTLGDVVNSGKAVRLVKVEEAATYIHAGVTYKLKLVVATDDSSLTCDVVVVDLSWAGTRRVVKATCVPLAVKRSRRSVRSAPLGGWIDVDASSNKIHEIANFSLRILNERSNEHNLFKFTRILKAQRQKVAGVNYKVDLEVASVTCSKNAANESCVVDPSRELQICSITVWDRPWLNQREVTDLSCRGKKKLTKVKLDRDKMIRRQIVGAPSAVDPNTPEMQEYAAFALQAINAQSNDLNQLKMVRIKDAAVQVVAGKNVILTMEVGRTTCKKGETGACPLSTAAPSQVCTVKVWDRPWLNDRRVTDVSCSPSTSTRSQRRVERSVSTSPKQKRLKYMNAFRSFMAKHKKVYKNWAEFERRYQIYRENQKKIKELRENELGSAVYGDTPFADLTEDEFKRSYTGLNPALRHPSAKPLRKAVTPDVPLPEEFDWRTKNVVTPVKNQGQCGSCWAFSVTGNVEGQYAIKNGKLLSFSEQELVDCDKLDNGCNGGLPENAYKAIEELGGLELEEDYPYDGRDEKCHLAQNKTQVQVTGGVEISQNETEMAQWLIQNGPISIGINANGMQFYRGGISHPWKFLCRPGGIDHGVLVVGYGISKYPNFNKTLPYWIIKNSWGTGWGEQGYYRIYRGDGSCGVNMMATSATIA